MKTDTGLAVRPFHLSATPNLEAPAFRIDREKVVQERLGHSTIAMTLDIYGHPFPHHDDGEELAAAERKLLG